MLNYLEAAAKTIIILWRSKRSHSKTSAEGYSPKETAIRDKLIIYKSKEFRRICHAADRSCKTSIYRTCSGRKRQQCTKIAEESLATAASEHCITQNVLNIFATTVSQ